MRSRKQRQQKAIQHAHKIAIRADRIVEAAKYRCDCTGDNFMVGTDTVTNTMVIRCNRCGNIYDIMAQTLTTTREVA